MEEEYGIKVSQYTVEAEEHIADDREKPRGAAGYCLAATQKIPLVAFLVQHGTKHVKLPRAGGSGLLSCPAR